MLQWTRDNIRQQPSSSHHLHPAGNLTFKVERDSGCGFAKVIFGVGPILPSVRHGDLGNFKGQSVIGPLWQYLRYKPTARSRWNGLAIQRPTNNWLGVSRQLAFQDNFVTHLTNGWLLQKYWPSSLDLHNLCWRVVGYNRKWTESKYDVLLLQNSTTVKLLLFDYPDNAFTRTVYLNVSLPQQL